MRLLSILLLFLFAACTPTIDRFTDYENATYEQIKNLPSRWEAPTLCVRLPEDVKEGDYSIEIAMALCQELAIRVYDAFDGQVYIPKFVIYNPSLARERDPGMCNLFKFGDIVHHSESYVRNPPLEPGRFYCLMPSSNNGIGYYAGTLLHEWLHTFIGLGDEYKLKGEVGNKIDTRCPLDLDDSGSCVMYLSQYNRQLCLPANHNPNTDQGKESCYSYAARVLFANRLAFIRVPKKHITHLDPPKPEIIVILK